MTQKRDHNLGLYWHRVKKRFDKSPAWGIPLIIFGLGASIMIGIGIANLIEVAYTASPFWTWIGLGTTLVVALCVYLWLMATLPHEDDTLYDQWKERQQ